MDGETNGGQEATQGSEDASQQQGQPQVGGSETDYEKQIAECDKKSAFACLPPMFCVRYS